MRRWRLYGQFVADRPGDPVHPGPPGPLRGPGRGSPPRSGYAGPRGGAPDEGRPGGLRAATIRGRGHAGGKKGPYATILAEALAADHLQLPGQPDGRWPTFAGSPRRTRDRARADRCRPGAVARRAGEDRTDERTPSPRGAAPRRSSPTRTSCWRSTRSSWATRCWSATARGPGVQPQRSARRPGWERGAAGQPGLEARFRQRRQRPPGPPPVRRDPALHAHGRSAIGSTPGWAPSAPSPRGGRRRWLPVERDRDQLHRRPRLERAGKLLWEVKSADPGAAQSPGRAPASVNFEGTPIADAQNVYVAVTDRARPDPDLCRPASRPRPAPVDGSRTWARAGPNPTRAWASTADESIARRRRATITIACSRSTGRCSTT